MFQISCCGPATPTQWIGLGCLGFARHYFRDRYYFLFLRLLRCFSSTGCHPAQSAGYTGINQYGFAHSETPGSKLFWQFPGEYRSQSRPSSTCSAKVSSMCRNNLIILFRFYPSYAIRLWRTMTRHHGRTRIFSCIKFSRNYVIRNKKRTSKCVFYAWCIWV